MFPVGPAHMFRRLDYSECLPLFLGFTSHPAPAHTKKIYKMLLTASVRARRIKLYERYYCRLVYAGAGLCHRMQMSPHKVKLPAHQSSQCHFNGLAICSPQTQSQYGFMEIRAKKIQEGEMAEERASREGEIVGRDVMERYVDCRRKNLFVSPELSGQSKFPISSGVGEIGCPGKERATLTANGKCPCHSNQVRQRK